MATKIRPIVFKINEPFVMNASNVVETSTSTACWNSPSYPDAYDGNGKHAQLILSDDISAGQFDLFYSDTTSNTNAPLAFQLNNSSGSYPTFIMPAGTYDVVLNSNPAPGEGYGTYLVLAVYGGTSTMPDILSKITVKILD